MNPLVSIITPCYNSEKWIIRYLDSVLSQTYDNIELIIINDGSTDKTEEIVNSYTEKFEAKGYKLIYRYQQNKGLGGAINTGLKCVNGEYFTWCDSDNFYTENYVATKVNFFINHPEYSIVRCDGYIVKDNKVDKPIAKMADGNTDKYNNKLFYNAIECKNFHFGCAMLRTSDFDKINPSRDIYESREGQNWQLLLPMFYYYLSGYIDLPMFYFVIRSDSVSNSAKKGGISRLLKQTDEYAYILLNTISKMDIPEKEHCYNLINIKYARIKMYYSLRLYNRQLFNEQFEILQINGNIKRTDMLKYYIMKLRLGFLVFIPLLVINLYRKASGRNK